MRFVITGLGRSGTKSLATQLQKNTSDHEVHHELDNSIQYTAQSFELRTKGKLNYGEVSGYLRQVIRCLSVDKKAVIIRDPIEILKSGLQRSYTLLELMNLIVKGLDQIHYAVCQGAKIIYFCDMISSEEYRQKEIYDWLGLECPEGFPWVNQNEKNDPVHIEPRWLKEFDWFKEKYKV